MTRKHRLVHRAFWPVFALVIGFGLAMALYLRPPPAADTPTASESK
ncbi:MAG TPA: hypothetical protein VKT73_10730 [Xanthobacteraceae bacterium]|nr:hypothetical protein [Xanthobacteraceae bacterium]